MLRTEGVVIVSIEASRPMGNGSFVDIQPFEERHSPFKFLWLAVGWESAVSALPDVAPSALRKQDQVAVDCAFP